MVEPTLRTSPPRPSRRTGRDRGCRGRDLAAARFGAGAGEHGRVADDDDGVLDEHRVGVGIGRLDLDGGETLGLEGCDVVLPLGIGQFRVDGGARQVRQLALGEVRGGQSHEGDPARPGGCPRGLGDEAAVEDAAGGHGRHDGEDDEVEVVAQQRVEDRRPHRGDQGVAGLNEGDDGADEGGQHGEHQRDGQRDEPALVEAEDRGWRGGRSG
jgi:hypothetical protein